MTWRDFAERFVLNREAGGASLHTIRAYSRALERFRRWYVDTVGQEPGPETITSIDVAAYRQWLQAQGLRPASVNADLDALRAALGWAANTGIIPRSPAAQVRRVAEQRSGPRALDRRTLGALLREAQREGNSRDVALITLLAQTGLRISEALALTWRDVVIRERSGYVVVEAGKGNKRREVPLTLTARRALLAWRGDYPDGAPNPGQPVFPGRRGSLTVRAVELAFVQYSRRAGIDPPVQPHQLRHTFCKMLLDAGVPLDRVAHLAGHTRLETTTRYTRPTPADLEAAVRTLEWL